MVREVITGTVVFGTWLFINSLSSPFLPSPMFHAQEFEKLETTKHCDIVLGNSRSLSAIEASALADFSKHPTLHLGYSSSDVLTQLTIFKYALSRQKRIHKIFIEVSPFHFDGRRVNTHQVVSTLIRRSPRLIFENSLFQLNFIREIFPCSNSLSRLKNAFEILPYDDYSSRNDCISTKPPQFTLDEVSFNRVFDNGKLNFDSDAKHDFIEILSTANQRNIELIIIFTPCAASFAKRFDNYESYKKLVTSLTQKYSNTKIIDLDIPENRKYLGNPDHIACPKTFTDSILIPQLQLNH